MKPQEDIGSFIKTKLQSTEKPSNEETWDRIQSSLKERKKKKRFVFFLRWGSGIALLSIIGFLILNNNIDTSNTKQVTPSQTQDTSITNASKTEDIHTKVIETNTYLNTETSTLNSLEEEGAITQDMDTKNDPHSQEENSTPKIEVSTPNTKETTPKDEMATTVKDTSIDKVVSTDESGVQTEKTAINLRNKVSENNITRDSIVNRNDVPVTHTSKKVYYYYNSKNGQEMSSMDKRVIDSIRQANEPKQDSLKID
ncbi:hypothetical protein [Dokdonia sp.]|uniref:hypothetical protein n=1 Tax=Dokdonia sp. TaxID=2024995 RepID=UPI003265CF01